MRMNVDAEEVWAWDLDCFITRTSEQTSEDRDPAKETEGYLVSEKGRQMNVATGSHMRK